MKVTTYFLEMHSPPASQAVAASEAFVKQESDMAVDRYRRLYRDVGQIWLWYERTSLSDTELCSLLRRDGVVIYTLQVDERDAGYVELLYDDQSCQILYFGLHPSVIGKGLGRYFLEASIALAFDRPLRRLWVHTCSLDHPRALDLYTGCGFREYRRDSGWVEIPEAALQQRDQARAQYPGLEWPTESIERPQ